MQLEIVFGLHGLPKISGRDLVDTDRALRPLEFRSSFGLKPDAPVRSGADILRDNERPVTLSPHARYRR